tara:strand:- start:2453 stop:3151 length:699 start_codon:yes stop_codon:yes gene_type:complete
MSQNAITPEIISETQWTRMPIMSEKTTELFTAIAKCQGEIGAIDKGKQKKGYNYSYTDLNAVLSAIKLPLAANGLSLVQIPYQIHGEEYILSQINLGDQWLRSYYKLDRVDMKQANAAQQKGSAISYARRYSIISLIGISIKGDDDDGKSIKSTTSKAATTKAAPSNGVKKVSTAKKLATAKQLGLLDKLLRDKCDSNIDDYAKQCGVETPAEMWGTTVSDAIKNLNTPTPI